jgi:hypothetical protein
MDYPFRVQSLATVQTRVAAIIAQGAAPAGAAPAPPQAGADPVQQYLARVVKLIPAEVVALYQGVEGVIRTAGNGGDAVAQHWIGSVPWFGLLLVIYIRAWGTRDSTGSWGTVQWGAVTIATISYIVWIIALGDPIAAIPLKEPWLGSTLLMVWPTLLPYFYKGN